MIYRSSNFSSRNAIDTKVVITQPAASCGNRLLTLGSGFLRSPCSLSFAIVFLEDLTLTKQHYPLGGSFPNRRRRFQEKLKLIPLLSPGVHAFSVIVHQRRTKPTPDLC